MTTTLMENSTTTPSTSTSKKCEHFVVLHSLCAICGQDISILDPDHLTKIISLSQGSHEVSVSYDEARRLEIETAQRLASQSKLSLVVDLDQTLVHASTNPQIEQWLNNPQHPYYDTCKGMHRVGLSNHPQPHYIKIRNNVEEFLENANELYELHVYTMGTRAYAQAVLELIDPSNKYFHERVVARNYHTGNWTKKELTRIFPCDDSMVVIIDDRSDVWGNSPNLIQVQAYEYFKGGGDINAPENQNVLDAYKNISPLSKELDEADDQLMRVLEVLKEIHTRFYSSYCKKTIQFEQRIKNFRNNSSTSSQQLLSEQSEMDVKVLLPILKSRVLQGCHITFSGLIPLEMEPSSSEIWKSALDFGAVCSNHLRTTTTHLVTSNIDTEKTKCAKFIPNIFIVKPSWLRNSIWNWTHESEQDHLWDINSIVATQMNPTILKDEILEEDSPSSSYDPNFLLKSNDELDSEDFFLLSHLDDDDDGYDDDNDNDDDEDENTEQSYYKSQSSFSDNTNSSTNTSSCATSLIDEKHNLELLPSPDDNSRKRKLNNSYEENQSLNTTDNNSDSDDLLANEIEVSLDEM